MWFDLLKYLTISLYPTYNKSIPIGMSLTRATRVYALRTLRADFIILGKSGILG